ncbi:TPA: type IV pilus major pilin [Escherichia coli]|mgnify:CR=1 FL=1|jgi:toxin coregulated pilin|uniref:type IV pilus major pilin n=1 Tax=Escherichia coli TaxID=562 RepID=UPI0002A23E2C|nr:type IV pilus major pilin [Escherichia coli]EEV7167047.1 type IV pilus major pilin [Escherichia coli]EEV8094845.1 type IV pilus major pilin [Escherichia coli]EEW4266927.1 type IV pilus major pilin [Escherichia coli]EEW4320803.1 type IV pilus major pilin [Escherichia coli]EEW4702458.1 type IV pilus major pilin [Escherichia coli]
MLSVYNKTQKMKEEARKKLAKYHELRKQRGMSLLEVIIVLGIIGTIAAGVVVLAQRAFDSRTVTELVSNTNTVRVAMKDAYQRDGVYPQYVDPLSLTADNIKDSTQNAPIAQLVQLGKLTADEGRNNISGDFMGIGGARTSAAAVLKGFAIELNGLSQEQCRSILGQVGNNWEYVKVGTSASGSYSLTTDGVDMTVEANGDILRSLGTNGQETLTAEKILGTCNATINSIILGSR